MFSNHQLYRPLSTKNPYKKDIKFHTRITKQSRDYYLPNYSYFFGNSRCSSRAIEPSYRSRNQANWRTQNHRRHRNRHIVHMPEGCVAYALPLSQSLGKQLKLDKLISTSKYQFINSKNCSDRRPL